jgi:hypothetical protein
VCFQPIRAVRRVVAVSSQPMKAQLARTQLAPLLALLSIAVLLPVAGTERRFYPSHKTEKEVITVKEGLSSLPSARDVNGVVGSVLRRKYALLFDLN